jgi:hypothetical protein
MRSLRREVRASATVNNVNQWISGAVVWKKN